jgi:hypothetical protein
VRTGGGLRVYIERPWFSSGLGELLGVALASGGPIDREEWKPFVSQWGQDPIWDSAALSAFPEIRHFPDAIASERDLPLDAQLPSSSAFRTVDVAGHAVAFDQERAQWYCDLTVDSMTAAYAPFVRLALVRYQPYALLEAKLSRVVLTDFAQLTPERAATVTADPYKAGRLRVAVSGPAPRVNTSRDPLPRDDRRTVVSVSVQRRDPVLASDLGWAPTAEFGVNVDPPINRDDDFILWTGNVTFLGDPVTIDASRYRLLIEEHEVLPADGPSGVGRQRRLIYAETVSIDRALLSPPPTGANRTTVDS